MQRGLVVLGRLFQGAGGGDRTVVGSLALGYAALAIISIILFRLGNGTASIWLPNVFAVAIILRNPRLGLAVAGLTVLGAAFAANLAFGTGTGKSWFYAVANLATVLLEVTLIRKALDTRSPTISGARSYLLMLAAGGIAAPALMALPVAAVVTAPGGSFARSFGDWAAAETLSFAILFPALMLADRDGLRRLARRAALARLAAVIGACVLIAAVVSGWMQFPFLLVGAPLLVAAAFCAPFELAAAGACVGVALLALLTTGVIAGPDLTGGGFVHGFQLSVALLAALPLAAGLVMERTRRDRRRIAESEQRFRRAMEDSAIGVAIIGLDGRILETNRAFAGMLGYSRPELEARTVSQITHHDDMPAGSEIFRNLCSGEQSSYRFETRYVRKDGTAVWARVSGSVINDTETGAPLHLVSQVEDIDAHKRAAEAIADAETRWSFALASAGQGMWDVDLRNGRVCYSSTWKRMLGYGEDGLDGDPDDWLTLVHPDDRERIEAADRAHTTGATPMFEEEFRMRHRNGHWLWILDRGRVVERDEDGQPSRIIGTLTDITMRREAEERLLSYAALLADEKERLRVTLDSIGDAVICTDAAMRITFMNPAAEKLTAASERDVLGKPLEHVYSPVDEESGERIATAAAVAGLRQRIEHNSRAILSRKDGSHCAIREVVSPIHSEKGEFTGAVIVFQDFTDARALQRRLAHAAAHDSLTGLSNRSSLLANLSLLVAEPDSEPGDLLLYIDLDNFKTVNDTGGHAAGDLLLKQVADIIRTGMRPEDIAARLGGDEFAMILRKCPLAAGEARAADLVAAIGRLGFERDGLVCVIGASVGLTVISHGDTDIDEIISRADAACYDAKANGRGRVTVLDVPMAPRPSEGSLARAS